MLDCTAPNHSVGVNRQGCRRGRNDMPRTSENDPQASRYMTLAEVAGELGLKSAGSVRNLIYRGDLAGVSPTGRGLRVVRKSFEAYCDRLEAEGAARFGRAS